MLKSSCLGLANTHFNKRSSLAPFCQPTDSECSARIANACYTLYQVTKVTLNQVRVHQTLVVRLRNPVSFSVISIYLRRGHPYMYTQPTLLPEADLPPGTCPTEPL